MKTHEMLKAIYEDHSLYGYNTKMYLSQDNRNKLFYREIKDTNGNTTIFPMMQFNDEPPTEMFISTKELRYDDSWEVARFSQNDNPETKETNNELDSII